MSLYDYADKVEATLRQSINSDFQNSVNQMRFDEVNVIDTKEHISELYQALNRKARSAMRKVARKAYIEAYEEATGKQWKGVIRVVAIIALLLNDYHPVMKYRFTSEAIRKRDRLTEAILANPARRDVRQAYNTAAKYWDRQAEQYVDFAVDEGRTEGFRDAGVEWVVWHTQKDDKVCDECKALNNNEFPIDAIPDKPHPRCRCYWTPVRTKTNR